MVTLFGLPLLTHIDDRFLVHPTTCSLVVLFGRDTMGGLSRRVLDSSAICVKTFHIPSATDIAHSVNIRHSSKLRTFMKELIADFQLLGDSWESMTKQIKFMQNRDVQIVNFLNQVYDLPEEGNKRAETIHKNRTESILRRLINERQNQVVVKLMNRVRFQLGKHSTRCKVCTA